MAVSFVDAPLDQVEAAIMRHLARSSDQGVDARDAEIDSAALPAQEYNPPRKCVALWTPTSRSGATVFFSNLQDGWFSLVHCLGADGLPCLSIRTSAEMDEWPVQEVVVHAGGKLARIVRVMKEGRHWDFFEEGERLPCEHTNGYSDTRVQDRLSRGQVFKYCEALGWPVASERTWRSGDRGRIILW